MSKALLRAQRGSKLHTTIIILEKLKKNVGDHIGD